MHDTALEIGRHFFKIYLAKPRALILDIGAQNVNGSLRDCAPQDSTYIGVDLIAGEGVDIVLKDTYSFPFDHEHFDAVVSTSCFEHDQMFWLTFLEAVRVTKTGGYIYLNAPSNGPYHCYPTDNWRFYPDASLALLAWARRNGLELTLMESFIAARKHDVWNDWVAVFRKAAVFETMVLGRIVDYLADAYNIRRSETEAPEKCCDASEDMILISEARDQLATKDRQISELTAMVGDLRNEISTAVERTRLELQPLRATVEATAADVEAFKKAAETWLIPMLERHETALRPGRWRRAIRTITKGARRKFH